MSRGNSWIRVRMLMAAAIALCGLVAIAEPVSASGIVINMPAPKKLAARPVAAPVSSEAPAAIQPKADVGEVALSRYAGARVGPYDTYDYGFRYSGYQNYNYGYGYPWFWGFPTIGCFGNQFFGFVGCPTPCSSVGIKTSVMHH